MSRHARHVLPNEPHHVTQRGNRREQVFFGEDDYRAYLALLAEHAKRSETAIWAYCLMPNHVHIIAEPSSELGLSAMMAWTDRAYALRINQRLGFTGHLWQARFSACAMDEDHLVEAVRYVCLNPVRAGSVARAEDWPWSSTRAHLAGVSDGVVTIEPVRQRVDDFADFLASAENAKRVEVIRKSTSSGRPAADKAWSRRMEQLTGKQLLPAKPGPRNKQEFR